MPLWGSGDRSSERPKAVTADVWHGEGVMPRRVLPGLDDIADGGEGTCQVVQHSGGCPGSCLLSRTVQGGPFALTGF